MAFRHRSTTFLCVKFKFSLKELVLVILTSTPVQLFYPSINREFAIYPLHSTATYTLKKEYIGKFFLFRRHTRMIFNGPIDVYVAYWRYKSQTVLYLLQIDILKVFMPKIFYYEKFLFRRCYSEVSLFQRFLSRNSE